MKALQLAADPQVPQGRCRHGNSRAKVRRDSAYRFAFCILTFQLFLVFLAACDPGHHITYENRTDQRLEIFVDGSFETEVEPLGTQEVLSLELLHPARFEAKSQLGSIVYAETLTWQQLRERNWRIVIQPND